MVWTSEPTATPASSELNISVKQNLITPICTFYVLMSFSIHFKTFFFICNIVLYQNRKTINDTWLFTQPLFK